MIIRTSNISDTRAISDIHSDSWIESYEGILDPLYLEDKLRAERYSSWLDRLSSQKENEFTFLAEDKGEIKGFLCIVVDKDPALGSYIDNLHISSNYRSNGLGRILIQKTASIIAELSKTDGMYLLVTQHNHRAQKFYSRLGGRKTRADSWKAPDGTVVPVFLYSWKEFDVILNC